MKQVEVPGGSVVLTDLFTAEWLSLAKEAGLAIADPPYGDNIVSDKWDNIDAKTLSKHLTILAKRLSKVMLPGAHLNIWGGFGTPGERALYRTLILIEDNTEWKCAEHITWKKKRAYGTDWRCLATREELLRFVLGNIKKPRVYHKQYTDEKRGYKGFNENYPAHSDLKRLTMIWDHASDMTRNKPHKCFKPEPLAQTQIEMCTNPGDLVLDLFAGSGEVSRVAREMDRPFIAFEASEQEFDKLVARLMLG